jgi:LysR family transcriptional regulator, regulator for bpeEF and oprC
VNVIASADLVGTFLPPMGRGLSQEPLSSEGKSLQSPHREAQNGARILSAITRTLLVQAPASLSRLLIAPALPRFLHQRPGLRVELAEVLVAEEHLECGIDAALHIRPSHDATPIGQPLAAIRVLTCASPDFIACNGLPSTPADLAPTHCIGVLEPFTKAVRRWIFSRGRAIWSIVPAAPIAFETADSAVAAAVHGGGYIRAPSIEVDEKLTSGLLQSVLDTWSDEVWLVSLIRSRNPAQSEDLAAFGDFVAGLFPSTAHETSASPLQAA